MSDRVHGKFQSLVGRQVIFAIVTAKELNLPVWLEIHLKKIREAFVVGLRVGRVVFWVSHNILDSRVLGFVFDVTQPAATADNQLDFCNVRQGELLSDSGQIRFEWVQGDAGRMLAVRHQFGRAFGGKERHKAHMKSKNLASDETSFYGLLSSSPVMNMPIVSENCARLRAARR
jgi:hypothetical protein